MNAPKSLMLTTVTFQNLSFFKVRYDNLDQADGFIHHRFIRTTYGNSSVIGNINLHAGTLDQ